MTLSQNLSGLARSVFRGDRTGLSASRIKNFSLPGGGTKKERKGSDDFAVVQAAASGQSEVMKLLLEASGAPAENQKASGSVIEAAGSSGNVATLDAALATKPKKGRANVNGRTRRGDTPLFCAVRRRDRALVQLLLDAGAISAEFDEKSPLTELMAAASSGAADIAELILGAGADPATGCPGRE